jgi:hypothetical protein
MDPTDPTAVVTVATPPAQPRQEDEASRSERRARAALDALRTLLRDAYVARFGAKPPAVAELPLTLRLTARPQDGWTLALASPFEDQVAEALDAAQAVAGAFEDGRVFCHRCGNSRCAHSAPADPWQVFRGYDATGRPEWGDFAQAILDAHDVRAEQLYAVPPAVLACVQNGHDLRKAQLSAFGRASRSYAILGQVVVGYLPSDGFRSHAANGQRLALTVQAVEARDVRNHLALRLNVIVGGHTVDAWRERLASRWCPWVGRSLGASGVALASLQRDIAACRETGTPPSDVYRRIPALLNRLAQSLEQGARQDDGRTHHAAQRREEHRPVHKALADVADSRPEHCFVDLRHNTWIVCGKQGRAHAFGRDGRLVTSLALPAGNAAFRVRTGRWRTVTPEEFAECRAAVTAVGAETRRCAAQVGSPASEVPAG